MKIQGEVVDFAQHILYREFISGFTLQFSQKKFIEWLFMFNYHSTFVKLPQSFLQ